MKDGFIITLSGISGAGKSHFIKTLLELFNNFEKLKAVTTRPIRKDEVNGVDKYFLSLEEFNDRNSNDEMCVVNNVFGNMYGYYKSDIEKTKRGINLITELYYKEVPKFKEEYPNTISIYIIPNDLSKTIEQLKKRNTSHEEYEKRIADIKSEINVFKENNNCFDIIISNDYDLKSIEIFITELLSKITQKSHNDDFEDILFHKRLDNDVKGIVDNYIRENNRRKIIYTSFDGDDMHFLHNICETEINRGNIPLNPETSLGYYVSTISLFGKKKAIMMDCLTLEMMADKISVYTKQGRNLSEGIIAEIMLWNDVKLRGLDIISGVTQLNQNVKINNWSKKQLEQYVLSLDDILKYELKKNLLNEFVSSPHKTAYIIANMENFKHIDWARSYCYNNGICPISPQNILPLYQYSNKMREYIESRIELMRHSDEILLFIDRNNFMDDFKRLDQFSLAELYFAKKYLQKEIKVIGWDEALVPKYNQDNKWALTTKEDVEIRKTLK